MAASTKACKWRTGLWRVQPEGTPGLHLQEQWFWKGKNATVSFSNGSDDR